MKEALRYFQNAQEILSKAPTEDGRYADVKYVQEACGTAYLAILKAIDEYFFGKGLHKKDLPKSVDGYRKALQKYLTVHNGKLLREFEYIYDELHIAGYYRGMLHSVEVVKAVIKSTKTFIEKISKIS
jgi:hypothetical protein